jgi:hypothetical protein
MNEAYRVNAMTVLGKIRKSIAHRNGHVVLRSELAKFGGSSQLTAALSTLINGGELVRMSPGIFAKAKWDCNHSFEWKCSDPKATFQEAFDKLHITVTFLSIEHHDGQFNCVVDTGNRRFTKPLRLGNYAVEYYHDTAKRDGAAAEVPADLDRLPKRNVEEYILSIAKCNKVAVNRSRLDCWAEAVTRAAGDSVKLDIVGQTLVALFKAHLINGKQMSRLMTNYMLEKKCSAKNSADTSKILPPSGEAEYILT